MPQPKEQLHAFEIPNWQGKSLSEISHDGASGTIEASAVSLSKRINPVALKLSKFAKWTDTQSNDPVIIASTKIYQWAQEVKESSIKIWTQSEDPEENEILRAIKDQPDLNPQDLIIWISPRDKINFKEGTRVGIYQVILINGEKYLFFRTLCNFDYFEECAKSAQKFLHFSTLEKKPTIFLDPEFLRTIPIPIKAPGNSLTDFLRKYLNFPDEVWAAIEEGKDLDEKIKLNEISKSIFTPDLVIEINQAKTFTEQARLGAYIEQELQARTGRRLIAGSCGTLYSSATSSLYSLFSPLPLFSSEGEKKFVKNCGNCGAPINNYISKGYICPHCGGVYEGC